MYVFIFLVTEWPPIGKIAAHSAYDMFSWCTFFPQKTILINFKRYLSHYIQCIKMPIGINFICCEI